MSLSWHTDCFKKHGMNAHVEKKICREGVMPKTGEKPGIGKYCCDNCFTIVSLDDYNDTLPPCPKCTSTEFIKC